MDNVFLVCEVADCNSPRINTCKDTYYVLGAGRVINCRQCAESRGWGGLRDGAMLERIQRRPRPCGPIELALNVTGNDRCQGTIALVEEMEVEEGQTLPIWLQPVDDVMEEKMSNLDTVSHLLYFLETAPANEVLSRESFIRLYQAVYNLLHVEQQAVPSGSGAVAWLHNLLSLWPWWSKLGCAAAITSEEGWLELVTLYQCRISDYLAYVRGDLAAKRDLCPQCRQSYEQCIATVLAQSPRDTMTHAAKEACLRVQSLHIELMRSGSFLSPANLSG